MNFSKHRHSITLRASETELHKMFDSAETKWNGPGGAPEIIAKATTEHAIQFQPESILIYRQHVQSTSNIPYSIS